MRTAMRRRYYCDHCKKASGSASAMKKHEASCTNNPGRVCRMCVYGDLEQKPMEELIACRQTLGFKAVLQLAENCPCCALAADRQARLIAPADGEPPLDLEEEFKLQDRGEWTFKKACTDFLKSNAPETDGPY